MAARSVSINELESLVGQELGVSEWHEIPQEEINAFADCTHDHQWIHVDPERAKKESPFGGPIAHGYLTLSHIPFLGSEVYEISDATMGVNYGLNKVRFPAPVPAGGKVRARVSMQNVDKIENGYQCVTVVTVEVEGNNKPACVAETVFRVYG